MGLEILSQMMKSDNGWRSCCCHHQSQLLVSSIILDRFEWSGNWVVITPNLPSFAPHFNSCRAGSVGEHVNDNGARISLSWSASQCRTSSTRLKIGRSKQQHPIIIGGRILHGFSRQKGHVIFTYIIEFF